MKSMIEKIKTVGDLRKLIADLDDDFSWDMRNVHKVPEAELKKRSYPYPRDMVNGRLESHDIGRSNRELCIGVYQDEIED